MPKFEKRFVHFMWDDELEGKKVFYADDIHMLIEDVTDGDDMGIVKESEYSDEPFDVDGDNWRFVYYDPYYELKWAYEQGITIQAHVSGNMWVDIKEPSWEDGPERYRIKQDENPVTHRELALWLAQGNGEIYHYDDSGFKTEVKTSYGYHQEYENCDCNEYKTFHSKIRKWGDTEWVTPTREYMGLEE